MKKVNKLKNKIMSFFGALLLVASFSVVSVTGFTTDANASTMRADCTCAERVNWLGKCRGDTVRFCKGDADCAGICGEDTIIQN